MNVPQQVLDNMAADKYMNELEINIPIRTSSGLSILSCKVYDGKVVTAKLQSIFNDYYIFEAYADKFLDFISENTPSGFHERILA